MTRNRLAVLLSFLVGACSPAPTKPANTIKIASAYDITGGTVDAIAGSWENAAILAVEHVNAAGGVNGHSLELIRVDSESNPDTALSRLNSAYEKDKFPVVFTGISAVAVGIANKFAATNSVV